MSCTMFQPIQLRAVIARNRVGLIIDPRDADGFLAAGQADLIGIGREALFNPNWAVHAEQMLAPERGYETWPRQYRWWLAKRAPLADPLPAAIPTRQ